MSKDDGGPAFARPFSKNGEYSDSQQNRSQEGMSLRDYFAAKAMQGMLAVPDDQRYGDRADKSLTVEQWQRWCVTGVVEHAYRVADAMLKARSAYPQTLEVAMSDWKDIASAPMDGTEVLLASIGQTFDSVPVPPRVTLGHYTVGDELLRDAGDCGGTCRCPEYEEIDPFWMSWDGGFTEENPPTHWQPLPAPPTE